MRTDDLDYPLPADHIARTPADQRDRARLMVVDPRNPTAPDHRAVADLPQLLQPGDLLILNDTRVLPARFAARRAATAGRVTGLFLETRDDQTWSVMLEARGKLQPGEHLTLTHHDHTPLDNDHTLELIAPLGRGAWSVAKRSPLDTPQLLDLIGAMPLPPYIHQARKTHHQTPAELDALDRQRYQTVYAQHPGAVAAPTAGLHFTHDLLDALRAADIQIAYLTLHVGMGTFAPVRSDHLDDHPMHEERFTIPASTLGEIARTRTSGGGRIIPVGTTCVRALESLPDPLPQLPDDTPFTAATDLLIQPGFPFRYTDGLMTNFHLPRSTLLALVAALLDLNTLKNLYQQAIAADYRFYSYGDAMLILP